MFVVRLDPVVNLNDPGVPEVVLSNLACKGVTIIIDPLTTPVLVAAIAILILPTVDVKESLVAASIVKSSPAPPLIVSVLVPDDERIIITSALLVNFICPQVILPFAKQVTAPVAGVAPPTFEPSNTNISVAPVEDGLGLPDPFNTVFQFDPMVILLLDAIPPTQ
jgi:hypothetical protein